MHVGPRDQLVFTRNTKMFNHVKVWGNTLAFSLYSLQLFTWKKNRM